MKYLKVKHVLRIHGRVIEQSGGDTGVRDLGLLDSAVAQPRTGFGGTDLYPELADKAAALAFSLVMNHPFADGNKRTGYVSMMMFLSRNGHTIKATITIGSRFSCTGGQRVGSGGVRRLGSRQDRPKVSEDFAGRVSGPHALSHDQGGSSHRAAPGRAWTRSAFRTRRRAASFAAASAAAIHRRDSLPIRASGTD